jgi:hypothetical protein
MVGRKVHLCMCDCTDTPGTLSTHPTQNFLPANQTFTPIHSVVDVLALKYTSQSSSRSCTDSLTATSSTMLVVGHPGPFGSIEDGDLGEGLF